MKWFSLRRGLLISILVALVLLMPGLALASDWFPSLPSGVSGSQVSTYTGGVSYSIPIDAPVGPGGMTPGLSLTYSSVGVDEGQPTVDSERVRMGNGWNVSGPISIIKIQTSFIDPVEYYLLINGTQERLYLGSDGYYHTRIEGFSQIKQEGTYWWMKTKDGTYYRLGYNADARHFMYYYTGRGSEERDYQWDVDLVEDIYGSQMYFEYYEWLDECRTWTDIWGFVYNTKSEVVSGLKKVEYTKRGGVTMGYPLTVEFTIEDNPTQLQCDYYYYPSSPDLPYIEEIRNYLRYKEVQIKVNGTLQKKYVLNYSGGNTTDYNLYSVTIYGADGTTAMPTATFGYSGHHLNYINNGTGGTKSFVYENYTLNNKTRKRVTSETASDGRSNYVTTTYAYGTPSWQDSEFRGHDWVKSIDAAGNYIQTYYYQDAAKQGLVSENHVKNAANAFFSKTVNTYNVTNPYTNVYLVKLTQADQYLYDGFTDYKQTRTLYAYDSFANPTKVSQMGDVSVSGDEVYDYTEYINDTTNWIIGVPKHNYTKKSDDATVVAENWLYYSDTYNGTANYDGYKKYLRKRITAIMFGARAYSGNPTVDYTYDQYGNITQVMDSLGNIATTAYDGFYHNFPISVTNALGQTAYTYYYWVNGGDDTGFSGFGLYGQVKSNKDVNGHFTRYQYDAFGRLAKSWRENFSETYPEFSYTYGFWQSSTNPNKVIASTRIEPNQTAILNTYTYSDGWGQVIQTQAPSEEAGKMMLSGPVDYNNRGLVSAQYLGYKAASTGAFISNPIKAKGTSFTYDAVGRVIRTDYPDGTYITNVYNKYVTASIDQTGKYVQYTADAYGRNVTTWTFTGSNPNLTPYASTNYEYDALGRPVKTIDAQGNQNTITYDNLGRKNATQDMDMGSWTYQYDKLGKLISQTDAKGQTITMQYDALGRLTRKTNPDATYTQYTYDTGSNSVGRLVKEEVCGSNSVLNIVQNTDLSAASWTKTYETDISYRTDGPAGTAFNVARFKNVNTGYGYWFSYGNYAPQEDGTEYKVSLWAKAPNAAYDVLAYTADNSETDRHWSEALTVPADGQWHLLEWFISTGTPSDSDSLSFNFINCQADAYIEISCPMMIKLGASSRTVATYEMNEGSGSTLTDTSGYGNTATISGAARTAGYSGGGLSFDGVDDYASFGYSAGKPANNFTLEAWVKPSATHEIDVEDVSALGGVSGQKYLFGANHESANGGVGVSVGTNGVSVYEHGDNYMPALAVYQGNLGNNWTHVAVVCENQTPKIYVNGVLVRTGLKSSRPNSYAPIKIGSGSYGAFAGLADKVAVYNSALSESSISAHYLRGIPAAARFEMNETSGSTLTDSSGCGNNATISGATRTTGFGGNGLSFDGVDDYAAFNYSAGKPANSFTLEAWVKPSTTHEIDQENAGAITGTSGQKYLFGANHEGDNGGVGVSVGTNGVSVYEHGNGYMPALAVYQGNLGNNWTHVAVVYENQTPKIYVNGVLVRTGLKSSRPYSYAPIKIGSGSYGAFAGKADKAAIYSVALSHEEILKHYQMDTASYTGTVQKTSSKYYYDALGRQIKVEKNIDGVPYTIENAYDNLDRVTYTTYPDGSRVYYTYNTNNGMVSKIGSVAGGDQYLKSQTFNECGLVTAKTVGNNVTLNYTYDPNNLRVTGVNAVNSGGTSVQKLTYTYNNAGMVTGIVDNANSYNWTYVYDDLYRLTQARRGTGTTLGGGTQAYSKSYAYNNINNITSFEGRTYAYGNAAHKHAVTSEGTNTYTYDANGNMTSGAGRTYTWSYDNKPTSIVKGGVTTSFTYDADGERVKKTSGSNWSIYVGSIFEEDQSGSRTCYIDAAGVSVKKKVDGSLYFILKDHLGGAGIITDGSGNVVTRQYYQPYGLDDPTGSIENEVDNHKFTGQEEDTETGLYYFNARYYDPALGRFVSADPTGGANRYAYCGNEPINRIDPSGYFWAELGQALDNNPISNAIEGESQHASDHYNAITETIGEPEENYETIVETGQSIVPRATETYEYITTPGAGQSVAPPIDPNLQGEPGSFWYNAAEWWNNVFVNEDSYLSYNYWYQKRSMADRAEAQIAYPAIIATGGKLKSGGLTFWDKVDVAGTAALASIAAYKSGDIVDGIMVSGGMGAFGASKSMGFAKIDNMYKYKFSKTKVMYAEQQLFSIANNVGHKGTRDLTVLGKWTYDVHIRNAIQEQVGVLIIKAADKRTPIFKTGIKKWDSIPTSPNSVISGTVNQVSWGARILSTPGSSSSRPSNSGSTRSKVVYAQDIPSPWAK